MDLLKEICRPGEVITLDFTNEMHRTFFCKHYGGEENMEKYLPQFYNAYKDTVNAHDNGDEMTYHTLLQMPEERRDTFVDGIDINFIHYSEEDGNLSIQAETALVKEALHIDEYLCVKTQDGQNIAEMKQSTANIYRTQCNLKAGFNPSDYKSPIVEAYYFVTWVEKGENMIKAQVYNRNAAETFYITDCIEHIDFTFPASTVNDRVVICYDRQPAVSERVDRTYAACFDGGIQKLFLDVDGAVTFKNAVAPFQGIDPTSFVLKLVATGMAQYSTVNRMDAIMKSFVKTDRGFSFALDKDWQDNVPSARLPLRDVVDITMYTAFDLADGKKGDFTISSTLDRTKGNLFKAQQLYLLWGCLAKGSQITMSDGSTKAIEEIEIGEKVLLEEGATGSVINIFTGIEQNPLICIQTAQGSLRCTDTHPVKTNHGVKPAIEINGEDCLLDAKGNEITITGIYPWREANVYNLEIEREDAENNGTGAFIICEGFLVGDNIMQNASYMDCLKAEAEDEIEKECQLKNKFFGQGEW